MKTFTIPYHTGHVALQVPEENFKAELHANLHAYKPDCGQEELIRRALAAPIGSPRLRELAKGKNSVVLVTSDHTRSVPSKTTLPFLLEEIRAGNPNADITILIATGLHRPTTLEEQKRMFGEKIVAEEKIAINDAFDKSAFVHVCGLPSGADFWVNRLAAECDLLLTEGFIEPHFFAGFSGGRKSILPGICSQETVNQNHSFAAIASPFSSTGVLEKNPIHARPRLFGKGKGFHRTRGSHLPGASEPSSRCGADIYVQVGAIAVTLRRQCSATPFPEPLHPQALRLTAVMHKR